MKPMLSKPREPHECDKDMSAYHFVLTGWKEKHWCKHPHFHKIPYSSHSSTKELLEFLKIIKPVNLVFNCRNPSSEDKVINIMCQMIQYSKNNGDIHKHFTPLHQQKKLNFFGV